MDSKPLTEKEERLLELYHDGECGWFARGRAERALASRPAAQEYLQNLVQASERTRGALDAGSLDSDKLWKNVRMRIEQEERSAVFLGRRVEQGESARRPSWFGGLAWGMSGGVVAALALFAVVRQPGSFPTSTALLPTALLPTALLPTETRVSEGAQVAGGVTPVQFAAGSSGTRSFAPPAFLDEPINEAVEVDWMRSDGRLRLLQDPSERSAIIWVKRKPKPVRIFEGSNSSGVRILNEPRTPTLGTPTLGVGPNRGR